MPPSPEASSTLRFRSVAALAATGLLYLSLSGGEDRSQEPQTNYESAEASPTVAPQAYGNLALREIAPIMPTPNTSTETESKRIYPSASPTDISIPSPIPSVRIEARRPSRSLKRRSVVIATPKPTYLAKPKTMKNLAKPKVTNNLVEPETPSIEPGLNTKVIRIPNWSVLMQCESSGDPKINTGNGFYGAYQFDLQTWIANGGSKYAMRADLATLAQQTEIAQVLFNDRGPQPWPNCTKITSWERIVRTIVIKKAA